jgi:hypothetical protein
MYNHEIHQKDTEGPVFDNSCKKYVGPVKNQLSKRKCQNLLYLIVYG